MSYVYTAAVTAQISRLWCDRF